MRVPLKVSNVSGVSEISIRCSVDFDGEALATYWMIRVSQLATSEKIVYTYNSTDDENKFFEGGHIYNPDGSVADNELTSKSFYFHNFNHAPLNKLVEQELNPVLLSNFLYGLKAGNYDNLKRIVVVRDRLNVPDWVALFVVAGIVSEETVRSSVVEVPNLFDVYPLEWVLHVLGVKADDVNQFNGFDINGFRYPGSIVFHPYNFDNFCKIIKLEKQQVASTLTF